MPARCPAMGSTFPVTLAALLGLSVVLGPPLSAQAADDGKHWGLEGGFGRAFIPGSLTEVAQDRYSASLSGNSYTLGLVKFHANGAPSYSLQFSRSTLEGQAAELRGVNARYQGSTAMSGFLATKHVNFVARRRFSIGMGFGAGIGPQLKADYSRSLILNGVPFSERKTYTLEEVPVTPLFEFQIRGEVRVTRNLSAGPWVGMRNAIPLAGGVVRVHFLK